MPGHKPIITEVIKGPDGQVISERGLGANEIPPPIVPSSRNMNGAIAASEVLSHGGGIRDALDAAVKARSETSDAPGGASDGPPADPETLAMIRYIHAIARLHSGRFEDLTPLGMLEVAMLCPYPVCSLDEWREKMRAVGTE